jgi:hypothetical protein
MVSSRHLACSKNMLVNKRAAAKRLRYGGLGRALPLDIDVQPKIAWKAIFRDCDRALNR